MTEALSPEWIEALVEASSKADEAEIGDRSGIIEFTIGKKRRATLSMVEGRIVGPVEAVGDEVDVDVTIPVTDEQLAGFLSGRESMAEAYIRGDVKPVGSTGPLLSLIELVESGALASVV